MAIRGVDISGLQNAFAQLGQSNALVAQREEEERRRKEAQRIQNMQTLGMLAGAAVGGAGLIGGGGLAAASTGAGIGQTLGGMAAGQAPSPGEMLNLGLQAAQFHQAEQKQIKQEELNKKAISSYKSALKSRYPEKIEVIDNLDDSMNFESFKTIADTVIAGESPKIVTSGGKAFQIKNGVATEIKLPGVKEKKVRFLTPEEKKSENLPEDQHIYTDGSSYKVLDVSKKGETGKKAFSPQLFNKNFLSSIEQTYGRKIPESEVQAIMKSGDLNFSRVAGVMNIDTSELISLYHDALENEINTNEGYTQGSYVTMNTLLETSRKNNNIPGITKPQNTEPIPSPEPPPVPDLSKSTEPPIPEISKDAKSMVDEILSKYSKEQAFNYLLQISPKNKEEKKRKEDAFRYLGQIR